MLSENIFCPNCGAKNEVGSKFCTSCGSAFPEMPVECEATEEAQESSAQVAEQEFEVNSETEVSQQTEEEIEQTGEDEPRLDSEPESSLEPNSDSDPNSEPESALNPEPALDPEPSLDPQATTVIDSTAAPDPQATIAMKGFDAADPDITGIIDPLLPSTAVHYKAIASTEAAEEAKKAKSKRGRFVMFVAALVIVAAVIGIYLFMDNQTKERNALLDDLAHKTYPISITIEAEGYSPETSSPIPLRIEGTTYNGNPVEEKLLINAASKDSIALERGTYTVIVPFSPVTQTGNIYLTAQATATFTISDQAVEQFLEEYKDKKPDKKEIQELLDNKTDPIVVPKLVLKQLPATNMTDSLITQTYEGLIEYGMSQDEAARFQSAMVEARQSAIKEQKTRRAADRDTFESQLESFQTAANTIVTRATSPNASDFYGMMGGEEKMDELRPLLRKFIDELFAYVLEITPESERAALRTSQTEWDDATTKDIKSSLPGGTPQNSSQGFYYQKKFIDAYLSRARDLINMID